MKNLPTTEADSMEVTWHDILRGKWDVEILGQEIWDKEEDDDGSTAGKKLDLSDCTEKLKESVAIFCFSSNSH